MKRITLFVLFLLIELNSFNQNLITNPGFETWETTIKPSGWATVQNCLRNPVYFMTGSYSCQHSGGTSTTKYLGQTLAVGPGKKYDFSFFYKTEVTGTGNGCRIWCYWKDAGGDNIEDPITDDLIRPSKYMKSDSWQQFSTVITAPPLAIAFYLEVRTYPNSVTSWDDFSFEENVATLTAEEKFSSIKIYPNPAAEYLNISNLLKINHIDILDLTGRKVWGSDFSQETFVTIPVYGFPEGVYMISIRTSDKTIIRKFIKKAN